MSNTPSLLGCPFCGGMATAKPIDSVPGWHHVTVLHSNCFYKPAQDKMLLNDEHLAAWNRRTPQPVARGPLTCEWTHNDDDGYWDTSCGKAWRFDDGGPKENNMNFCHCCGKTLRIKGGQHGTE